MIRKREQGFTLIELLVLVVIIGILATLVAMTYGGVQASNRNADRQGHIDTIKSYMESYYAQNTKYPTLANLNDANWRAQNLKDLEGKTLQDPKWNDTTEACTANSKPTIVGIPASNCYAYQVTASDGSACDNVKVDCAQFTLTAMLEGGEKYVKSSLN